MCDYSLMAFPNRLARDGEELTAHRFPSGTMGFVSKSDAKTGRGLKLERPASLWAVLRSVFEEPKTRSLPAVCIPPGSRVMVKDISPQLQREIDVRPVEEATFTQTTASPFRYRDALRFRNGREVSLQRLREGQRVRVLDLSCADATDPRTDVLALVS
jgi:hypothetical protein